MAAMPAPPVTPPTPGAAVPPWSAAHPYVNLYTHKTPITATVVGNYRVTGADTESDIHHIVPKDYLQKNGFPDRGDYNQVANFVLTETSINISISNKPPTVYMAELATQVASGVLRLGEITDAQDLARNLAESAVPVDLNKVDGDSYREFLVERRKLMAAAIRDYYLAL